MLEKDKKQKENFKEAIMKQDFYFSSQGEFSQNNYWNIELYDNRGSDWLKNPFF